MTKDEAANFVGRFVRDHAVRFAQHSYPAEARRLGDPADMLLVGIVAEGTFESMDADGLFEAMRVLSEVAP